MFVVIEIYSWLLLIVDCCLLLLVLDIFPPYLQQALSQITLIAFKTVSAITYGARKHCFVLLNHSTIFIILFQRNCCT